MVESEDLGTLSICALRYCLDTLRHCVDNRFYLKSNIADIIKKHWAVFTERDKATIEREIKRAIEIKLLNPIKSLSDKNDIAIWEELVSWIEAEEKCKH